MDNDAFRALINKQRKSSAPEKSTKEIAREAVEDEFQKKRRRGGGGGRRGRGAHDADGYGSDSGGSSDEDVRPPARDEGADAGPDDVPEWKRRRREKRRKDDGASEYRDRARERREGKNTDYAAFEGLAPSGEDDRRRQAELSKYLGGDEEHTHLVKGLDKSLAEKVRREEMGQGDAKRPGDLDQMLEDAYTDGKPPSRKETSVDWRALRPKTELGKSVLAYLLEKRRNEGSATQGVAAVSNLLAYSQAKSNPTIQKSIKRSVLTFSLNSDVQRRNTAWEVPRMTMQASGARDGDDAAAAGSLMRPLNRHMIATISKKLDEAAQRKKEMSHNYRNAHAGVRAEDGNETVGDSRDKGEDGTASSACADAGKNSGDDSDDDIFDNVGSYVPREVSEPTADASGTVPDAENVNKGSEGADGDVKADRHPAEDAPRQEKKSVFDNLLPAAVSAPPVQICKTDPNRPPKARQDRRRGKDLIDRDVLGAGQKNGGASEARRRRWGPRSAAAGGVSMSAYDGGYGEEMDTDFGGDEDRRAKADEEEEAAGDAADAGDEEED